MSSEDLTILSGHDLSASSAVARQEAPAAPGAAHDRRAIALELTGLVGVAAVFIVLYYPTMIALYHQWSTDQDASHGFLVPLIAAYLVWARRADLKLCPRRVAPVGYLLLGAASLLLILGEASSFGYPSRVSIVVALAGLVLLLGGAAALRLLSFPIAYLLFMIPLPTPLLNMVAFPLQLLAAKTATTALDLFNVPVLREGNIIDLPMIRLEVTEACSGIRSLIALLALAVIFAYFVRRSWWDRVILSLSAIPIAIVANAARITVTGMLTQWVGVEMAQGFYHEFSGTMIFVAAFVLLVAVERALPRSGPREAPA